MIHKVAILKINEHGIPFRSIRSFVIRQRRITKEQQYTLDNYWTEMGIKFKMELLDFTSIFSRIAPLILEIGFGMCNSLATMAQNNPHKNFLGIEVYMSAICNSLLAAKKHKIKNLRLICHDAVEVLEIMIPDNTLQTVQIFFPDPWPKLRHNKRRIIQIPFVELILRKLNRGGILHLATDWKSYAEYMLKVMNNVNGFINKSESNDYILRPETRPLTKFEQRGQQLNHSIWDLRFEKK